MPLSDATRNFLERFLSDLYEANRVMNLTRVPREQAWSRHVEDSLLFEDLIPVGSRLLDVGTGPGFPAWPLAVARPDLAVTALDSNGKMLGFLRDHPLPNLTVVQARAEDWDAKESFDVVTGRALAPLAIQLELSARPCALGGAVVPMRTESNDISSADPRALGLELERTERRILPDTDVVRVYPIYRKVSATPKRYPRRWAEIKRSPLSSGR